MWPFHSLFLRFTEVLRKEFYEFGVGFENKKKTPLVDSRKT
jgi:hypothetical protein